MEENHCIKFNITEQDRLDQGRDNSLYQPDEEFPLMSVGERKIMCSSI